MNSIADGSIQIHISSDSQPATPSWLGEVALVASHLQKQGILNRIGECVRFARRRFGRYDVLDFLAVLFGYAISGERTLEAFYESVQPFAVPFMAVFGRASLPAASTLSRFLAALPASPVEALRTLFLEDLLARRLGTEESCTGLWDRQENRWLVFDIDGHAGSSSPTCAPPDAGSACAPASFASPLCTWLHWAQTGRSGTDTHNHLTDAYPSVDRQLWQSWQRTLSGGAAPGEGGYPGVPSGSRLSHQAHALSAGRPIWHWSGRL